MLVDVPEELLALIRRFEGLRLHAYRCPAGVLTIGYGHTGAGIYPGMPPITHAEAESMLYADAMAFVRATVRVSPGLILEPPNRLAAIADFCYNLGITRYKSSRLRHRVATCQWDEAAVELSRWVRGGGKVLPGLVLRRRAEAELLLRG